MNRSRISFLVALFLIGLGATWAEDSPSIGASAAPATIPEFGQRNLLACADYDHFWVARVIPGKGAGGFDQTRLHFRNRWGGAWVGPSIISSRVMSIACRNGELLLVLEDGGWMIADESNLRIGPPPPNRGKLIAIANQQNTVWAIVLEDVAATEPAT
jgi:hypothetical protein